MPFESDPTLKNWLPEQISEEPEKISLPKKIFKGF